MRIVFAGTPEVAVPSLEAFLAAEDMDVVAVLTRPDARRGRGRSLERSPIGAVADAHGLEVLTPTSLRDPELIEYLTTLDVDAVAVVAYGLLVPAELLDVPRLGWINLHFSLLPAYRGAAPVQGAVRDGLTQTGLSTFRIDAGLDTGEIYRQETVEISPRDTAGELLERLSHLGAPVLVETLRGRAAGTLTGRPQEDRAASHIGKISTEDAHLDFTQPAAVVSALSRAVTPAPGAWAMLAEQRLKLGAVFPDTHPQLPEKLPPGELVMTKKHVFVGTATTPVALTTVQAPGKKALRAVDWARGARLEEGTRLS